MSRLLKPEKMKVLIAERSTSVRKSIQDALRALGFQDFIGVAEVRDVFEILESEAVDWVITGLDAEEKVNGVHLLKLVTEHPGLKTVRVSFMVRDNEGYCLPLAYELGLLSHHSRALPGKFPSEFETLLNSLREHQGNEPIVAAMYLRQHLKAARQFRPRQLLEKALLKMYPGSVDVLMMLAESYLLDNQMTDALRTLKQVSMFGEKYREQAEQLLNLYGGESSDVDGGALPDSISAINAFDVETCIIVDPDTTVQYALSQYLKDLGIPKILTFECGSAAWSWIEKGGRPDLIIQEWRLEGLSGAFLLQRVRARLPSVPVVVVSSLVQRQDQGLTQEMGVAAMVEKPFEQDEILRHLVFALQQHRCPTEQASMERKILQFLAGGNKKQAKRLLGQYLANESFGEGGKVAMQAHYAYSESRYNDAADFAVKALRRRDKDLILLNLLGRCLLQLRDFSGAIRCFEQARELSPRNIDRLCDLALANHEAGNVEASRECAETANSMDGENVRVMETKAQLALAEGDASTAQEVMNNLDSLKNVVAFMNNKAVALTRSEKYEDGIKLYQQTLSALPGDWGPTHDVVSYNLSLANIRYMDFDQALEVLGRIEAEPTSRLGMKVASIKARLETAIERGEDLVLESTKVPPKEQDNETSDEDSSQDVPDESRLVVDLGSIEAQVGDVCCYRIFFATTMMTPEMVKLLESPPHFKLREPITRAETLSVQPGSAA